MEAEQADTSTRVCFSSVFPFQATKRATPVDQEAKSVLFQLHDIVAIVTQHCLVTEPSYLVTAYS